MPSYLSMCKAMEDGGHFWFLFLRIAAKFDNLTAFEGRAVTTGVSMAQGWRFLFQFSLQSEC
jgi:hypothetical protein